MEAIMSLESIYKMLSSLTDANKKWLADHLYQDIAEGQKVCRKGIVSDEELEARLAQFPAWDETEHADLSSIDYGQYRPYRSRKNKENILKWL